MRPKRCRGWEELHCTRWRDVKLRCTVGLESASIGALSAAQQLLEPELPPPKRAQLWSVFKYLCRLRRAIPALPALTLRARRLSSKGASINSPYFSDCQQIPHKKNHKPSMITPRRNACGLSPIWLLRLWHTP